MMPRVIYPTSITAGISRWFAWSRSVSLRSEESKHTSHGIIL